MVGALCVCPGASNGLYRLSDKGCTVSAPNDLDSKLAELDAEIKRLKRQYWLSMGKVIWTGLVGFYSIGALLYGLWLFHLQDWAHAACMIGLAIWADATYRDMRDSD